MMGGPLPINTAAPGGYSQQQQHIGMGVAPNQHMGGPPQYGQPPYPNQGQQGGMVSAPYTGRNNAVEVEGAGRSKSQLIVGIDFVSS